MNEFTVFREETISALVGFMRVFRKKETGKFREILPAQGLKQTANSVHSLNLAGIKPGPKTDYGSF